MKKLILSISLLSSLFCKAQFTEANHAPTSGDAFATNQCDSTNVSEGLAGASAIWDYSALNIRTNITNNYVASVSSNTANSGYLVVSSSLTNSSYYSSSPTFLKYHGGNITAGTVNATLNYSVPAIVAVYPMSLNTTTNNAISGSGVLTGLGPISFVGTCSVIADGTGVLTIGTKTHTSATRVKTTQVLNVNGGLATVTLVNYEYYVLSKSKRPVLTISTTTLASGFAAPSSQSIITVAKDYLTVGIDDTENEVIEVSVFPNPSNSFLNINIPSLNAYKINAYDITGKLVVTELIENGNVKLDVSNINSGIYIYSILGKNNETLKAGKFNVTK